MLDLYHYMMHFRALLGKSMLSIIKILSLALVVYTFLCFFSFFLPATILPHGRKIGTMGVRRMIWRVFCFNGFCWCRCRMCTWITQMRWWLCSLISEVYLLKRLIDWTEYKCHKVIKILSVIFEDFLTKFLVLGYVCVACWLCFSKLVYLACWFMPYMNFIC